MWLQRMCSSILSLSLDVFCIFGNLNAMHLIISGAKHLYFTCCVNKKLLPLEALTTTCRLVLYHLIFVHISRLLVTHVDCCNWEEFVLILDDMKVCMCTLSVILVHNEKWLGCTALSVWTCTQIADPKSLQEAFLFSGMAQRDMLFLASCKPPPPQLCKRIQPLTDPFPQTRKCRTYWQILAYPVLC